MGLTLELANIAKIYNGLPVLRDCSYRFAAGGFYVLMGPNGSGKTTLFRIAALLENPDQGEVRYFAGEGPLAHDLALRRRITMVFPRVGVFNTTVFNNVAYGLRIRGVGRQVRQARVEEILDLVGLVDRQSQRATTLSSGETMRLALARALVISPEVLLLDEPTTHIDRANTEIIETILLSLRDAGELTLILITHDRAQADRLGGRRLFLEDGQIVAEG